MPLSARPGREPHCGIPRSANHVTPGATVIERTFAWINRFRRLAIRYERRLDIHHALTALACSLICLNALQSKF
ncbi:hypothetical protein EBE87_25595 [Pseudoroseomonas wenyumeiae]|uniref:Uncharacterized protein n=1 Tax=Teichococcus wenyumeiae TaxID=2478470 RepID=A0A3A9JBQ7_9PROT|nr:hypothetical protein D6Z83_21420 [Pseudoroseomonas wenyumeiae]RMI15490.1 hypothetical protein EBE87_25595 [Pseudoroseomonas wenyumeiae]